jgi:hypothetical protein
VGAGPVPVVGEHGLHPAEHRALRELYATSRALARHWEKLGDRLEEVALQEGARAARDMIAELAPRAAAHAVPTGHAAAGAGMQISTVRRVRDHLLERNQALRLALLDVQHVITVCEWLGALAAQRGDAAWEEFHARWAATLRERETAVRAAVHALAADPDGAVGPADSSPLGRAGAKLGEAIGAGGEAVDRRLSGGG